MIAAEDAGTVATHAFVTVLEAAGHPDSFRALSRQERRRKGATVLLTLSCMIPPILWLCVAAALLVWALGMRPDGSDPFLPLLPGRSVAAATGARHVAAAAAFANAAVVVVLSMFFTCLFAAFFRLRARRAMLAILAYCKASGIALLVGWLLRELALRTASPHLVLDWVSLGLLSANFGAVGSAVILEETFSRRWRPLCNAMLLLVGLSVAWIFLCFDSYSLLAVLLGLVVWDLYAVLGPGGPIRYIIALERHYRYMATPFDLPDGLAYQTEHFTLGVGDFIFYAVLAGRAAMEGLGSTVFAVAGILLGLVGTAFATVVGPLATLPALPLSIVAGAALFAAALFALERGTPFGDMLDTAAGRGLYL